MLKMKKIEYNIHKCSSFTSIYVPENIKLETVGDLSSRWSSESNVPPQYIILKLNKPAIVKTITFGKYEQTHACNVRKFKIFGGLEEHQMVELLAGNLKNDTIKETFVLKHTVGNGFLPIRFIKIVPILSWSPSFNFTIWYVELTGDEDQILVDDSIKHYIVYREREIVRLCMKHFRQHNYMDALRALESDTNVSLEDPQMTEFHNILVANGDYDGAERYLENAMQNGIFEEYIGTSEYTPVWTRIDQANNNEVRPGMRGGHQMCIDPYTSTVYLFGGWDGNKDLNDLWSYDINTQKWTLLMVDVFTEGGPSPRSCHKMCIDTIRKQIFVLGRYLDIQYRSTESLQSDFYMYDIQSNQWLQLSEDTSVEGGPYLIFDHQMCMDDKERILYVFGGRVLSQPQHPDENLSNNMDTVFSGLFMYHVAANIWKELIMGNHYSALNPHHHIISRVGHSMVFHPVTRKLYIFAGQRNKEYMNDFVSYDVDSDLVMQIYKMSDNEPGVCPTPGFTQRATLDPETDEIYVLSGLSKEKEKRDDNVQNSVWVYKIKEKRWICIYQNENSDHYWKKQSLVEPCPRFAHQLVYDHINKIHYLFGGNPGRIVNPKLRLDDFWKLQLCKPSENELLHTCRMMIREHQFKELARTDPVVALDYLRTKMSELVDHSNPKQIEQFHNLASVLFHEDVEAFCSLSPMTEDNGNEMQYKPVPDSSSYYRRAKLYEDIVTYFPRDITQPKGNIADLLKL